MKKFTILFITCLFCLTLFPQESSAIKINLRGKAGAYYKNGKWKVCPGFSFKKCATLKVTWKELIDWVFGSEQPPAGIVEVLDEEGNPDYTINVTIVGINQSAVGGNSPPAYIMGDDIGFVQN